MQKIEEAVKRRQGNAYQAGPPNRSEEQYRKWVEELYKVAVSERERFLVTCAEQLREYHIALEINNSTRMKDALKRLGEYFEGRNEDLMTDIEKRLIDVYHRAINTLDKCVEKEGEPVNPKLTKLKEFILMNYREEQEEVDEAVRVREDAKKDEETAEGNSKESGKSEGQAGRETGVNLEESGSEEKKEGRDREREKKTNYNSVKTKAKGIVFTKTRDSTKALLGWIEETEELCTTLRPQIIVGSGDDKSMYQQQTNNISKLAE